MSALLVALVLASADGGTPELQTVVTAARDARPRSNGTTTVVVIPKDELRRSPSQTMDALIRAEPSVATFRRNSSLVADPTAQGVNLRGVGPSGVSRALVLVDGLPQNDPFGGWVFWRSLPKLGVERIEISPGPGATAYGSAGLGGTVQIFTRDARATDVEAELSGGNLGTLDAAARARHHWDSGGAILEADVLRTDGYRIVAPDQAGRVDRNAGGEDVSYGGRIEVRPADELTFGVRLSGFQQDQNGGTAFTDSKMRLYSGALTSEWKPKQGGTLQTSVFLRAGQFEQRRARIAAGRNSESLAAQQTVPMEDQGGAVTYVAPRFELGVHHRLSTGLDVRRVAGTSRESVFVPDGTTVQRANGGEQLLGGVFVQDSMSIGPWLEVMASLRADGWRNTSQELPARSEAALSPRAGVRVSPWDWLTFRASGGSGFRAPTLNELYRPFQVGTVFTAANDALVAERLVGAEAGVEVAPFSGTVARLTGFWNRLENPVTNVSRADGTRQRQNLGAARIQGLEAAVQARVLTHVVGRVGYTLVDARVVEDGGTGLSGKRLAQDPMHRGVASLSYDDPRFFTATTEVRVVGPQFEDDLNALELGGVVVVGISASRRLWKGFEVFGAVENLLDRRYVVGRAGVDTYGAPLMARLGLRHR